MRITLSNLSIPTVNEYFRAFTFSDSCRNLLRFGLCFCDSRRARRALLLCLPTCNCLGYMYVFFHMFWVLNVKGQARRLPPLPAPP